jgi:outer membrane protein OmpA-like peptidoglycan-associated protein
MRSYTLVFFLCAVSYFSYGQKSLSFSLGSTARSLQQASNRRDVLLDYTSVGAQFSYFTSPKAELFSGVSYGFQSTGTAKFAGAQAGMRYFLNLPLPARLRVFGQFAGEVLLDNSYAITNRDADFIGAAGAGFDFKISSAVSLRGSANLGLPFLSTGSLSPYTNSGSNFTAGIGLVFLLPSKKEAVVAPVIMVVEDPIVAAVASPEPVKATVPAPVIKEQAPVVAVAPVDERAEPVAVPAAVVVAEVNLDSLFNKEIYFKTDKSWVGPESAKKLDLIVALMAKYPDVKVHLKGHTDYRKSEDYNLKLSAKRVENVRLYLVKHGVAAARFKAEAFSEEVPASKTDLQLNRRVEVRIWR